MEQPLKETIKDFLQTYGLNEKINQVRLNSIWEQLMGKIVAQHTTHISLSDKKLFISFDSAALREELSFAKSKVIKMINEEFEEDIVEEIVFR